MALKVFVALCVLTCASLLTYTTFWQEHVPMEIGRAVMLTVSLTKAFLVVAFFMHLWWESKWKYVVTFPALTVSALLCISLALWMTDFSKPIPWGWNGPGLAALIQLLNAVGALTLVFAFRYGKAIIVSPVVNAGAPLLTALLSLLLAGGMPSSYKVAGIVLALTAALLLAVQPEEPAQR